MWSTVAVVLVALATSSSGYLFGGGHQTILNMYRTSSRGDGTYYGNKVGGTCSYGTSRWELPAAAKSSNIKTLVALNAPQFLNSLSCGMCLKITGSGQGLGTNPITGTFYAFVKDLCPECHSGSVDLAENGDGRWKVSIQAVQCPVGNSPIEYSFQGSNAYYVKLQIRNARIPITSVQLQRNGQWVTPRHVSDNYWVVSDGQKFQDGGIPIKMTAANGKVLNDVVPRIANQVLQGQHRVQVPYDSSLPSA